MCCGDRLNSQRPSGRAVLHVVNELVEERTHMPRILGVPWLNQVDMASFRIVNGYDRSLHNQVTNLGRELD